jgi:hypothetical protein
MDLKTRIEFLLESHFSESSSEEEGESSLSTIIHQNQNQNQQSVSGPPLELLASQVESEPLGISRSPKIQNIVAAFGEPPKETTITKNTKNESSNSSKNKQKIKRFVNFFVKLFQ